MVLTQQMNHTTLTNLNNCFHTTMVLTQHGHIVLNFWNTRRFHTTMVLTQHEEICPWIYQWTSFPYHYGSYATSNPLKLSKKRKRRFHTTMVLTQPGNRRYRGNSVFSVSIPLWFLRNRFYYKDIIQVLGRQNQPTGKIP